MYEKIPAFFNKKVRVFALFTQIMGSFTQFIDDYRA